MNAVGILAAVPGNAGSAECFEEPKVINSMAAAMKSDRISSLL
jgi:hypothetical protein